MLEHIVLLKVKDENASEQIISSLRELPSKISVIKDLSVGKNFSERSKGFNIGLRVMLESEEDLNTYRNHPDHVKVLEEIVKPNIEDVVAVDYFS